MARKTKRRRWKQPPGMGLVPFMNLILILIPALLVSASFAQAAVIDASQTPPPPRCETEPTPPPSFALQVRVTEAGFTVASEQDGHRRQQELALEAGGEHPWAALTHTLRDLKDAHPETSEITLSADEGIPYSLLVRTMDATREDEHSLLFPGVSLSP